MAAAEDSGSEASTTVQGTLEEDELDEDDWHDAVDDHSAEEYADTDAASDPGSGSDDATDRDWLRVQEAPCGGDGTILVTVSLLLAPVGLPGGKRRRASYLFQKQLETILYGGSTSSGAVHRAIQRLNLDATVRQMDRKSAAAAGLTSAQYEELMGVYQTMARRTDPLAGPAKKFSLVPISVAGALGVEKKHKALLKAMGRPIPRKMAAEERSAELAAEGGVDLVTEGILAGDGADSDCDELAAAVDLHSELTETYLPYQNDPDDDTKADRSYALKASYSKKLKRDIDEYTQRRTASLSRWRSGRKVEDITASADTSNLLRFCGFVLNHRDRSRDEGSPPETSIRGLFHSPRIGEWVEEYLGFLDTRGLKWSSRANYVSGLINVYQHAARLDGYEELVEKGMTCLDQLLNLRRQCDAQASVERLYKRLHPEFIEWEDVQLTRLTVLERVEKAATTKQKFDLLSDALLISLHSVTPPDRVGVIRRLKIGYTLRKIEIKPDNDQEAAEEAVETESERWCIDMRKSTHKTSRFYGPSVTPVSLLVAPLIDRYLEARLKIDELEYDSIENTYLFQRNGRALTSSQWSQFVKQAFGRHSPNGQSPPPKVLRASFITHLRSSDAAPEVLKSAARAQRHQEETQGSDLYDVKVHMRLVKASFDWCESYARQVEKERAGGGGKGKGKEKASSGRGATRGRGRGRGRGGGGRGGGGDASSSSSSSSRGGRAHTGKGRANESEGASSSSQEQALPSPDVSALVGTTVHRKFGDVWHSGTVSLDGWYRVTYEDGDADDLSAVELQQLVDGAYVGATISYYAGAKDGGWCEGVIQEPFKRSKHGAVWIPVDQIDKTWSGDRCFQVDFADGHCPIDLRSCRRISDTTDAPVGSWYPLEDSGKRN